MKIYLNDKTTKARTIVEAKLVKKTPSGVYVKLEDGNIIHRKDRQIPIGE